MNNILYDVFSVYLNDIKTTNRLHRCYLFTYINECHDEKMIRLYWISSLNIDNKCWRDIYLHSGYSRIKRSCVSRDRRYSYDLSCLMIMASLVVDLRAVLRWGLHLIYETIYTKS